MQRHLESDDGPAAAAEAPAELQDGASEAAGAEGDESQIDNHQEDPLGTDSSIEEDPSIQDGSIENVDGTNVDPPDAPVLDVPPDGLPATMTPADVAEEVVPLATAQEATLSPFVPQLPDATISPDPTVSTEIPQPTPYTHPLPSEAIEKWDQTVHWSADHKAVSAAIAVPFLALFICCLRGLYLCRHRAYLKQEQTLFNMRSAQARMLLGDMQMVPTEDPDEEEIYF